MKDLNGKKFGRLQVVKRMDNDKSGRCVWLFKCDCGKEILVKSHYLTSGGKRSCGCLQKEINSTVHKKHGKRKDKLYGVWQSMKTRCNNKNHKYYKYYGGKGVYVCTEWEEFEPFYKWAMSNGYEDGLTIDRIDSDGGYYPENCRWATHKEQTRNRKITIKVKYQGKDMTLSEIAEIEGIKYQQAYRKYIHK